MPDPEDEDLFVAPEVGYDAAVGENLDDEPPESDELEITIEGEEAPKPAGADSDLVRKLRAEIRERDNRLKTYEAPKTVEIGPKPTFEDCEYDNDKYDEALLQWNQRKSAADNEAKAAAKQREESNRSWQAELQAFETKKAALGAKDFDAAEEAFVSTMSQIQQAVVLQASSDPAKVVYALGKHPEQLAALAAIQNPIKLTLAVAALEGKITVNNRRAPPEPESRVRGSAPLSRAVDKTMERLEKEAEKTGDRTAVRQYRQKLAAAGKK